MDQNRGYHRRGNPLYRPSEGELCACAQACNVDRGTIESVTLAHPEQQRRLEGHITTGSYMETIVFESIQKLDRGQKDFLITAFEAVRFENCLLRTRLVQYGERVLQVVLGDRAEWIEGLDSSDHMGNNSMVRMNFGHPLFRYAFLEDEDKPTYFVWTINYSCLELWMRDVILDDLRAVCSDFNIFLGRLRQQLTLPVRACDPYWASALPRRQYMTFKSIHADYSDYPDFDPLEYMTLSGEEPLEMLHLPAHTQYADVELAVVGHAAWALACATNCTVPGMGLPDINFTSIDPISSGNLQGYQSLSGPIGKGSPVCIRIDRNQPVPELLSQIEGLLAGKIGKEHGITKVSGVSPFQCHMAFQGIFQRDPVDRDKTFAIFDPGMPPAIFECKQSIPPSHDYGLRLDIQRIENFIIIQSTLDTIWGPTQVDTVLERFGYFFEAIVKGWGDTVGSLLAEESSRSPKCAVSVCDTLDSSFGDL